MSNKLEIEMPIEYPFLFEMPIRKTDIAMDIHVSFASILDIVFEGHIRFFEFLGHKVTDVYGKSLIFANAVISYKGELLADDLVQIQVVADNFLEKGCDLFFRLSKEKGKIPVADVKIRMLFFDYTTRKVAKVPEEFKSKCLNLLNKENLPAITLPVNQNSPLWDKSHQFALKLYEFTTKFPKEETDNLVLRIRKAATSLPLLILENSKRKISTDASKSFARLRGHIEELRYYLILSHDLKYVNSAKILIELEEINQLLKDNFKDLKSSK